MFINRANELFQSIGENKIMYLSTCVDNRVTSRAMSFIIYNQKLYFQTDKTSLKYEQITKNPNVAVCIDNIQIEGVCKHIGGPLDNNNNFFSQKYKEYFRGSFDKYSSMKNEVLVEVTPTHIELWNYDEGRPYQEFLDFNNQLYDKKYYNCNS